MIVLPEISLKEKASAYRFNQPREERGVDHPVPYEGARSNQTNNKTDKRRIEKRIPLPRVSSRGCQDKLRADLI